MKLNVIYNLHFCIPFYYYVHDYNNKYNQALKIAIAYMIRTIPTMTIINYQWLIKLYSHRFINTITTTSNICTIRSMYMQNRYLFTKDTKQATLKKYERIKQKQKIKQNNIGITKANNQKQIETTTPNTKIQNIPHTHYSQNYKLRCQGCNVILQSKDNTKYGYITEKVLNQVLEQNRTQINQTYGQKLQKSRDSKILDFMHEVQKQTGVKIFNSKTNEIENLDNVEILMRLQQKIQKYEEEQQLANRRSKIRKHILCFRCYSLKHQNRLPQQYDTNVGFTTDTTQFILNKMLNRHKDQPVEYFFLIDALDVLGTFQQWLFKRLIDEKLHVTLIVNKIDVINKQYLNEAALHVDIKQKLQKYLKNIYKTPEEVKENMEKIKIFYISCNSRDGMRKLTEHIEGTSNNLQLVGYPNTGKTTLLNILAKIKKSISKVPGTTIKITQHQYSKNLKRKVYDMPGLYSQNLLYNLIQKPSIKTMLTWHKRIAPGLLTQSAFIYGGKVQIPDTRIIIFGHGGACSSTNKWFIDHYKQFWKGLPQPHELKIKKYEFDLEFTNGRADDLEIAGYGFIGFRLCIPNVKKAARKLTLFLPQKVSFQFRPTVLSVNDNVFHNKSALTKRFMLQRLTINEKQDKSKAKQKKQKPNVQNKEETSKQKLKKDPVEDKQALEQNQSN